MGSTITKLFDYINMDISDELCQWRITDEEILEALKLLGKDHAFLDSVDTISSQSCLWAEA